MRATNGSGNSAASGEASGTPKPPQAKIYWTDYSTDKIQRANLDGTTIEDIITGLSTPEGIAVHAASGKIYWADSGMDKIQRANLDGTTVEDLITSGLNSTSGIALDVAAGKMYWLDYGDDVIQRANLDGSGQEDLVTSGLKGPEGIALDVAAGKMYWTDISARKIQHANLDGSGQEDFINSPNPIGIALDVSAGKVYWAERDAKKIQRANISGGSNVETIVTESRIGASPIALDVANDKVYWINTHDDKMRRASMSVSAIAEDLVTSGLVTTFGIALLLKPGKPRELTATAGGGQVTLAWKAPTPDAGGSAASYEYQYKTATTTYTEWVDAGTGASTVVTNLIGGTEHTFRVRALNLLGGSPESNTANVIPPVPGFGEQIIPDQTNYLVGVPITPLTLPQAVGGSGTISYALTPSLTGLSFDNNTRVLSGTPLVVADDFFYRYTAIDATGASGRLSFAIIVRLPQPGGSLTVLPSGGGDRVVGETLTLSGVTVPTGAVSVSIAYDWWRSTDNTLESSDTQVAVGSPTYTVTDADVGSWLFGRARLQSGSAFTPDAQAAVIRFRALRPTAVKLRLRIFLEGPLR